jgi:AcrR family transcriptional regulator
MARQSTPGATRNNPIRPAASAVTLSLRDAALRLFKRDGYEQTTMEAIAEAAEVSVSTLYRYFPSKDLILLDSITGYDNLSAAFSQYAVNLPVEEALAEAILEWAKWEDANTEELRLLYSLIAQAPIARARLWDFVDKWMRDFTARLAEKLHLSQDDLQVELSARLAFDIIGAASIQWRVNPNNRSSSSAIAKQALQMFEEHKVLRPRLASRR